MILLVFYLNLSQDGYYSIIKHCQGWKEEVSMKSHSSEKSVFDYLDFREYLKDKYLKTKETNSHLSIRAFAKKAGLKTHGYLKMIIDGKRRLTYEVMQKFIRALKITGKEKKYFETLVFYNQEEDSQIKDEYFAKLNKIRPHTKRYLLEQHQHNYLSRHYYVCIREMVVLPGFKEDPRWLAKRLWPPVKPTEAQEALDTLVRLGMLKREKGKLKQVESYVDTFEKHTPISESGLFHEASLDKAKFALKHIPQTKRSFQALTIPMQQGVFDKVAQQFYDLLDKVVDEINDNPGTNYEDVYQINFQIFPVTQKRTT